MNLEIRDINKTFKNEKTFNHVLEDISLTVEKGDRKSVV